MVVMVISSYMRLSIRVTKQSPNANADSFRQDKKKLKRYQRLLEARSFKKLLLPSQHLCRTHKLFYS